MIAVVGLLQRARLARPTCARAGRSWFTAARSRRAYYAALYAFWAALLVVPIAGNLARRLAAGRGHDRAPRRCWSRSAAAASALEAGWKYLVLTTLGLSVALLGIVVLAIGQAGLGHSGLHALDWRALERRRRAARTRRRSSRSC